MISNKTVYLRCTIEPTFSIRHQFLFQLHLLYVLAIPRSHGAENENITKNLLQRIFSLNGVRVLP